LRVVLVGTGTGVGKTHVACALLAAWAERTRVAGLKPVETGVPVASGLAPADDAEVLPEVAHRERDSHRGQRASNERGSASERGAGGARNAAALAGAEVTDQERLAKAAALFHVKRNRSLPAVSAARPNGVRSFHVKHNDKAMRATQAGARSAPHQALFKFREPVSPHLAARQAGVHIDPRAINRWVREHEAPVTIIETAGGLFSPLGDGLTNFDLLHAVGADVVILVAPDRLGVLHDLTATLGLAKARGGPEVLVVLSTPAKHDASTGRNAAEIAELGIARPISVFPRAAERAPATLGAARAVIAWIEARRPRASRRRPP
jgi:dethiobiotin synthetase